MTCPFVEAGTFVAPVLFQGRVWPGGHGMYSAVVEEKRFQAGSSDMFTSAYGV